jgi:hypothetical protein
MAIITPKFLTPNLAAIAVQNALNSLFDDRIKKILKPHREHLHIVILVPGMKDDRSSDYADWPNYPQEAVLLYEHSRGNLEDFEHPFHEIARCKALQLWHDRNDGGTDTISHLLFPGDTPFWGGVKRQGIVVACSGLKPWIDKMLSGMVADILIALARNEWENSNEKANKLNFLT